MNELAASLAQMGDIDLLDGGAKVSPKPSLANGVPAFTPARCRPSPSLRGSAEFRAGDRNAAAVGLEHHERRADRYRQQRLLRPDLGPLVRVRGIDRSLELRRENALPADFAHIPPQAPAGAVLPTVAGTPRPGSGDLQFDSADRDGAAQEWTDVRAALRRAAAISADRRHVAAIRGERFGAGDRNRCRYLLCGGCRCLVYGTDHHRALGDRDLGAGLDLYDPAILAALLRDLREDL